MFDLKDIYKKELNKRGISEKTFLSQLEKIAKGSSYIRLIRPALPNDGIKTLSQEEKEKMISLFSRKSRSFNISKFVPASGAATRMFMVLIEIRQLIESELLFNHSVTGNRDTKTNLREFEFFLEGLYLKKFAFSKDIHKLLCQKGIEIGKRVKRSYYKIIIESVLDKDGLNYGNTPKALIKFHNYKDAEITPMEEHINETCLYLRDSDRKAKIHFTISDHYKKRITRFLEKTKKKFSEIEMDFSYELSSQNESTDTVATYRNGYPVTTPDDQLLFRPGGHGSLLYNLNSINSDIVFIKNIDNVATLDHITDSINHKRLMGGIIIDIREKIFKYLNLIPKIKKDSEIINNIYCYSKDILNISFGEDFTELNIEKKKDLLKKKLNRPIRVCGMVENRGEPGGGPFWIKEESGESILQIVEKAQIDTSDRDQLNILNRSKFFNPVDIVCSITDYRGENFYLPSFSDESKYFVSEKYYNGEKIKVLEHPGLWNGSMNDWITIFIEIPVKTFNPVKSVTDLLKSNHIPGENICFYSR